MTTFENSSWDGSPSNWESTEAYCADCLIDTNATGATKTQEKCKLPYRKSGSSAVNKNALKAMVGGRGITAVKGVPSDALRKAANWIISKYKEAFGTPAPDSVYRIAGKNPPTRNKALLYKDKAGEYWFVGIYSNNFEDDTEDIITWKAHQEYAKWVTDNKISLPITVLHQPHFPEVLHVAQLLMLRAGKITPEEYSQNYKDLYAPYAIGESKAVIPVNGFVFVIGKILKNKIKQVELLYKSNSTWGMSHGFIPLSPLDTNVIEQYRTFEFSILPNELAANKLTVASIKVEK